MTTLRTAGSITACLSILTAALTIGGAPAEPAAPTPARYEITITNVTRGQIFSPPLVVSHNSGFRLFELGEASSAELAQLAEEGDNSVLAAVVAADPNVRDFRASAGPIMPGESVSILVIADDTHDEISLASMLVSTNDAFTAVRNLSLPTSGHTTLLARAYDAGSEANSEDCAFIPGPPCGSMGAHDPAPAEGYVHIHAGIHGNGSIAPSVRDWRDAVAEVKVKRYTN